MKRYTNRIAIFLLLGLITTIAIAWGCAFARKVWFDPARVYSHADHPRWSVSISHGPGTTRVDMAPNNHVWSNNPNDPVGMAPRWSAARERPSESLYSDETGPWLLEYGHGWPFICGVATLEERLFLEDGTRAASPSWEVRSGIRVLDNNSVDAIPFTILPTMPVLSGLVANTAVYGIAWWLVFFAPMTLLRWRRRHCGRCVKCGYDLRGSAPGSACPECGTKQ